MSLCPIQLDDKGTIMGFFGLLGTLVNAGAVILGAAIGLVVHVFTAHSEKHETGKCSLGKDLSSGIMAGLGLCAFLIGVQGAVKAQNVLVVILSMTIGAAIGILLDLDGKIVKLGDWVGKKVGKRFGNVSEGFVGASLLFCVGAMAVTGSLESGLTGNHATLYAKSMMDFVASIVFASTMGGGVVLSAVSVLLYQGSITMLASLAQPYLSDAVITEMSTVGSLLIVGIALNMMGITKIKLMNYVPAIFLPILLCQFM